MSECTSPEGHKFEMVSGWGGVGYLYARCINEGCNFELDDNEILSILNKNAALRAENQRLQQELYDMENDESWRQESLASDERIRDEHN